MSERKDPSRSSTESPKTDVSPISDGRPTPTLYQRALQRKRLQRKATNANAAAAQTPTDIAIAGTESASAALPHQEAIQC